MKISTFEPGLIYLPDFDALVWRLPSGTQAYSQVCFGWMSKCVIRRGLKKFGALPHKNNYLIKFFVCVKTCTSFLNNVSSTSLDIALKVFSRQRRRVVLLMRPNFSLRVCLWARGELMLTNFGLKTDLLTFLENKRLFARTVYFRLLIYLKAIYWQKMKEIDFSTAATRCSIYLDRPSLSLKSNSVRVKALLRCLLWISLCCVTYEYCKFFLNTPVRGWAGLERFLHAPCPYNLTQMILRLWV